MSTEFSNYKYNFFWEGINSSISRSEIGDIVCLGRSYFNNSWEYEYIPNEKFDKLLRYNFEEKSRQQAIKHIEMRFIDYSSKHNNPYYVFEEND